MSLSKTQLDAIAEKLGIPSEVPHTAEGLSTIYKAWSRNVGYDNVSLLKYLDNGSQGMVPGIPSEVYFDLWLEHDIANFCWANAQALSDVLNAYGFRTARAMGTMGTGRNLPIFAIPHGSLLAWVNDDKYLVDATFLCEEALALVPGEQTTAGTGSLQVWSDADGLIRWQLPQSRFSGSFRLEDEDVSYDRFIEEHKLTIDGLANGRLYRDKLYMRRNVDGGTVTYDQGHIVRRSADSFAIDKVPKGEAHDLLQSVFGLSEAVIAEIPEKALH